MCLSVKLPIQLSTPEQPIICYKIMHRISASNDTVVAALYQDKKVFYLDEIYDAETSLSAISLFKEIEKDHEIASGFFHSFVNYRDAVCHLNGAKHSIFITNPKNLCIVKCYIPRCCFYCKGKFFTYDAYASTSICFQSIVDPQQTE